MAAGQGFKTFTTGEVLTAGDVNGYLMQGINVFTNATARDAAITAPAEGQFAFTKDNNSLWYYDGGAWVASGATGDIEGVTANSPLTGGGTSGTVTVGIQDASTTQRGSVQLSDSTSTTSSVLAATPTAVKAAYDLAAAAIPKTLTTTTGDTIYASSANTPARLGIGTSGQVLTVSGGLPTWATPSSGGMTQIATGNLTGAAVTISSIPATYNSLRLTLNQWSLDNNGKIAIITNNDTSTSYTYSIWYGGSTTGTTGTSSANSWVLTNNLSASGQTNQSAIIDFPLYNNADNLTATALTGYRNSTAAAFQVDQSNMYRHSVSPVLNRIDILATFSGAYNFDNGTYTLWGIK